MSRRMCCEAAKSHSIAIWRLCAAVMLIGCLAVPAGAQNVVKKGPNLVEVTVVGMGMTKKDAVRDALRKAVERAAGTYIYSQSKTKDFVLIRDTILTRSAGFVQSYEEISAKQSEDGVWAIKVKAVVSIKGIVDTWGVVKNLLMQMGRPKVMVFITERIDRIAQGDSTVQTRIENLLLKSGFLLVNRQQIKEIQRKDLEAAIAEDNPAKMQAVAKRFGAHLFIAGSTNAVLTSSRPVYGVTMHRYGADGDVKCYRSDTAQLLSALNDNGYSADRTSRVAAKKSLTALGDKLAPKVQGDILRFWRDVLEGRGEVVLEVEGASFKQYLALKKALATVKGVKDITAEYANQVAKCSIQSDVKAETLAERIVEAIENLDITDVSQNVIKAKLTN